MLGRLSLTHILLFIIILVLLFGARRLPELGGAIGKTIREFKKGYREDKEERKE
jgi:sec-independent protein translocase protein TatA